MIPPSGHYVHQPVVYVNNLYMGGYKAQDNGLLGLVGGGKPPGRKRRAVRLRKKKFSYPKGFYP